MIAVLGSALSLAAAAVAKRSETERNRNAFERRAGVLASAVAQSFQLTREVVLTLPALFEASITVEQNEFSTFVRPALARHRSLAALEWAPLVLDADRPAFEAKLRSAGYPDFEIREPSGSGKLERSGSRSQYLPLTYLEPAVEAVRGLEVLFEPSRRVDIEAAIDQGTLHVSHRFRLVEDPEGVQSVAVYAPGYDPKIPLSGPVERRRAFLGLGIALFRLRPLIDAALAPQLREGISLALLDPSAPEELSVLYETEPGVASGTREAAFSHREQFAFGNRRYTVISVMRTASNWTHWLVLSLGLGLTAVAAAAYFTLATIRGLRRTVARTVNVGQYTLEEKIGEGGMGVVYRAAHALLRRPAAIKLLLKDTASQADLARFEREVQLTSRLAHPNTISIFDYGRTQNGVFYYVMEYLDGLDLDRLVREDGPLDPGRAIHILAQVSGALAEAHLLGLVHRDIKPANIVLTERRDEPDVVKVVDFGLVKTLEPSQSELGITQINTITGTPLYLAPEAITSPQHMDGRTDLYALGAVAYFILTGEHVFQGATVLEVLTKHLLEEPEPPSKRLGRPFAADLEAVVLSCLAKDRGARPESASALRAALLACEDAERYDMEAARVWWRERGVKLRNSSRLSPQSVGHATTMAIDLHDRPFADAPPVDGYIPASDAGAPRAQAR
jgi:serine/threonine protein kinase/CHASE1-domain containing sensor protein